MSKLKQGLIFYWHCNAGAMMLYDVQWMDYGHLCFFGSPHLFLFFSLVFLVILERNSGLPYFQLQNPVGKQVSKVLLNLLTICWHFSQASSVRSSQERSLRMESLCWRIWHIARKKRLVSERKKACLLLLLKDSEPILFFVLLCWINSWFLFLFLSWGEWEEAYLSSSGVENYVCFVYCSVIIEVETRWCTSKDLTLGLWDLTWQIDLSECLSFKMSLWITSSPTLQSWHHVPSFSIVLNSWRKLGLLLLRMFADWMARCA